MLGEVGVVLAVERGEWQLADGEADRGRQRLDDRGGRRAGPLRGTFSRCAATSGCWARRAGSPRRAAHGRVDPVFVKRAVDRRRGGTGSALGRLVTECCTRVGGPTCMRSPDPSTAFPRSPAGRGEGDVGPEEPRPFDLGEVAVGQPARERLEFDVVDTPERHPDVVRRDEK